MAKLSTRNLSSATRVSPAIREENVKKITAYHEPAFSMLNESSPQFYPKNPFMWSDEMHISLMKSEITTPVFYTELVDEGYNPSDPNRTLYRFRGDKNYINEYFNKIEQGVTGEYIRYFVPLHDFEKVDLMALFPEEKPHYPEFAGPKLTPPNILVEEEDDRSDDEDALMSKLTIRDHAAIQWKLPVSKKDWLNKLIKQVNKI